VLFIDGFTEFRGNGTEAPAVGGKPPSPSPATSRILTMTRRKLLRIVEFAEILGVSKQRADQLRLDPDFPAPVDRWARGDLWAAADVRRWPQTYAGGAARWGPRSLQIL
jgi:predicted DNA-binding transcriptional regulator AlpA